MMCDNNIKDDNIVDRRPVADGKLMRLPIPFQTIVQRFQNISDNLFTIT